jgi:hypothetical protein
MNCSDEKFVVSDFEGKIKHVVGQIVLMRGCILDHRQTCRIRSIIYDCNWRCWNGAAASDWLAPHCIVASRLILMLSPQRIKRRCVGSAFHCLRLIWILLLYCPWAAGVFQGQLARALVALTKAQVGRLDP